VRLKMVERDEGLASGKRKRLGHRPARPQPHPQAPDRM
jgi:hypothetical protein